MVSEKDIELICRLNDYWTPQTIKVTRIIEGETNRDFRVEDRYKVWFVRLPYESQSIVDRKVEVQNIEALRRQKELIEILPVFHFYLLRGKNVLSPQQAREFNLPDGTMVTPWLEGKVLNAELLRQERIQEALVRTLHTFHTSGVKFVNNYDPFDTEMEGYKRQIKNLLELVSARDLKLVEEAEKIAREGLPQEKAISTHNDLIFGNLFLCEDGGIRLLDFEYAGFNVRDYHYDFGTLLGENLFYKLPLSIEIYNGILEKASCLYDSELDPLKAYYGALTNVLVTFWWGLLQYQNADTEERRQYFGDYVPKRIEGIGFLRNIIEKPGE